MKRAFALVEGLTEEAFVNRVVQPHLLELGLHLKPIVASTARSRSGAKFRGGIVSYGKLRRDLVRLLGDSGVVAVTTMLDFYGLPDDFPGLADLPNGPAADRVQHLERSLSNDFADRRLLPYLSLHEFEALVFAAIDEIRPTHRLGAESLERIDETLGPHDSPEEINDGARTHPAARLAQVIPRYKKTVDGVRFTVACGLLQLRRRCPHFDSWLCRLEQVADD